MMEPTPLIDQERCTGCGDCVEACPQEAVALVEGKASIVEPDACDYCTECEPVCPQEAISCPFEIVVAPGSQGRA